MQLTYDPHHNIAYIRLREKSAEVETLRISDELNIDLTPDWHRVWDRVIETRSCTVPKGRPWSSGTSNCKSEGRSR